jgi:hypothetical protein
VPDTLNLPVHPTVWAVHTYSFSNCRRHHSGFHLWLHLLVARLLARSARCLVASTRCPTASMRRSTPPVAQPPRHAARSPWAASAHLGASPSHLQLLPRATSAQLSAALGRLRPSRLYHCRPTLRQPPRPRRLPSHRGSVFFDLNLSECG